MSGIIFVLYADSTMKQKSPGKHDDCMAMSVQVNNETWNVGDSMSRMLELMAMFG
jgi:hypothetical protein